MKIIITGISSYIGSYLAKYFLEKGFYVVGVSKTNPYIYHKNFKFKKINLEEESLNENCPICSENPQIKELKDEE